MKQICMIRNGSFSAHHRDQYAETEPANLEKMKIPAPMIARSAGTEFAELLKMNITAHRIVEEVDTAGMEPATQGKIISPAQRIVVDTAGMEPATQGKMNPPAQRIARSAGTEFVELLKM